MSVTLQQQQAFINQYLPLAQSASAQTGLPTDYILGQAALETGYGTSNLAQNQNNFFGIGGPGNFQSYTSPQAGFQAFANLINNHYDTSGLAGASPTQIANSLASQGYTGDAGYGTAVGNTTSWIDSLLQGLGISAKGVIGAITGGSGLGVGSSFGNPVTAPNAVTASPGSSGDPWYVQIEKWLSGLAGSAIFVVLGVVLLIGAVIMFARNQGIGATS